MTLPNNLSPHSNKAIEAKNMILTLKHKTSAIHTDQTFKFHAFPYTYSFSADSYKNE